MKKLILSVVSFGLIGVVFAQESVSTDNVSTETVTAMSPTIPTVSVKYKCQLVKDKSLTNMGDLSSVVAIKGEKAKSGTLSLKSDEVMGEQKCFAFRRYHNVCINFFRHRKINDISFVSYYIKDLDFLGSFKDTITYSNLKFDQNGATVANKIKARGILPRTKASFLCEFSDIQYN